MDEITKSQDSSEESSIYSFTRLANGKYSITARVTPPKITQLTIPSEYNGSEVARVKYFGFPDLKELTLSSSVRMIDDGAFEDCEKLTTIHFSGSKEDWIRIKDAFPSDVKVLITESFVNSAIEEEEEEEDLFADAYVLPNQTSEPEPETPTKESVPFQPAAPKKKKRSLFPFIFSLLPLAFAVLVVNLIGFGSDAIQNETATTLTLIAVLITTGIRLIITLVGAKRYKFRPRMKQATPVFFKNLFFVAVTLIGFGIFFSVVTSL